METKANHLMIGAFVLVVAALGFGFVYWLQNLGGGGTTRYAILFEGSVTGLTSASKVLFNGIGVGSVESLAIDPVDARRVRVVVGIVASTPVRINSRARIVQLGLTGGSAVQISAGTPDAGLLASVDGKEIAVIKADRAASGSLFSAAPEALGNANALLVRLNDLVANNEDSIRRTVTNVESFSTMLDGRKEDIGAIITDARALTGQLKRLASKLEVAVDDFRKVVSSDSESFLMQAQEAAKSLRRLATKLEDSVGNSADGLARFAKTGLKDLELFMRDGRRAVQSFDRVMEKLEKDPKSFLFGGSQLPEYNPSQ